MRIFALKSSTDQKTLLRVCLRRCAVKTIVPSVRHASRLWCTFSQCIAQGTKLAAAVKDFGIVVLCMVAKKVRKTLACCKTFLSRVVILRIV